MSHSSLSFSSLSPRHGTRIAFCVAVVFALSSACASPVEDAGPGEDPEDSGTAEPAPTDAGPEPTDAGPESTDAGPEPTDAGPEPTDAGLTDAGPNGEGTLRIDVLSVEQTPVYSGTVTFGNRIEQIENGRVLLTGFPEGPLRGIVRAPGFAPANVFGVISATQRTFAQAFLIPVGATIDFPANEVAHLRYSTVGVLLQPNSFVDSAGKLVTGTITARITAFDPETHMAGAPGPFRGTDLGGDVQMMETFGMGEFSFESEGAPVNLAPNVTATVEIMLPRTVEGVIQGEEIPAWSYDLETGQWVEEAMGVVGGGGERLTWRAEVPHFSWWNVDKAVTEKECIVVKVQAESNVGVPVYTEGLDYNGVDLTQTDANGDTCVEFKRGGEARLRAGSGAHGFTYSLDITGGGDAANCAGGGCSSLVIDIPPQTCVSGTVTRNSVGLEGAMVTLSWGPGDSSYAYTNADGTFCGPAPVGVAVNVYVTHVSPQGLFIEGDGQAVTGNESGVCSLDASCASAGIIELVVPAQYCLEGVTESRDSASNVDIVAPGTPVYAFRTAGFTEVNCALQPASWGSIIARGTVGVGGNYCLTLPFGEDTRDVIFAVDSCYVGSCATDLPGALCSDNDTYSLDPGDDALAIGGTCATSGCLANDILFE